MPEPLGVDEHGRDTSSYLPGLVPNDPVPAWVWRDEVLTDAARLVAQLHAAGAGFDTRGAIWRTSGPGACTCCATPTALTWSTRTRCPRPRCSASRT